MINIIFKTHLAKLAHTNIIYALNLGILLFTWLSAQTITIFIIAVFYDLDYLCVINMVNKAMLNLYIILPIVVSVNLLFIDLLRYTQKFNLVYPMYPWLEVLSLIFK